MAHPVAISPDIAPLDASCNLPLDVPFTAAVARSAGVPQRQLRLWCRLGLLRRPVRGVYVVSQLPDSLRLRVDCLALIAPDDAVICDRHAGWLHGAEMTLAPNEHLDVLPVSMYLPTGRRLRNGVADSGERRLRAEDITEILGIPVTTKVRTAWDLGRVRRPEVALSAADQMLRLPGFPADQFRAGVERFRGMRWVTILRLIAPLADGRAESPPESVLRWYWLVTGLPRPQPQLEIWADGVFVARVDLGNEELGYVAEYYGEEWHRPKQIVHDERRVHAIERAGFEVDVFRKENVYGQHRDVETLLIAGARRAQTARPTRVYL